MFKIFIRPSVKSGDVEGRGSIELDKRVIKTMEENGTLKDFLFDYVIKSGLIDIEWDKYDKEKWDNAIK